MTEAGTNSASMPAAPGMNSIDFTVEAIPNEVHPAGWEVERGQNAWLAFFWPAMISVAGGALCYWAAGVTLGLFLGGLMVVALITSPLLAGEDTWLGRGLAWGGAVHGVAAIWLVASVRVELDLGIWAACYLVLATMAAAIAAITVLMRSLRFGRVLSGAIVTVAAVAWLTWPIWLAPVMHGQRGIRMAAWLIPANPAFAVNGVVRESMGVWTEQAIAYHLTSLNDEVPYALPERVVACLLLHAAIGGAGIGLVAALGKLTRKGKP